MRPTGRSRTSCPSGGCPGRSIGCITAKDSAAWKNVATLIANTMSRVVIDGYRQPLYRRWMNMPEFAVYYGTLEVE